MFGIKLSASILLLSTFTNGGATSCGARQNPSQQNRNSSPRRDEQRNTSPTPTPSARRDRDTATTSGEMITLAQGNHSAIEERFVAVIRDGETYAALRALENNLPQKTEEFFRTNVVIAAFLGTRSTSGYSVQIVRSDVRGEGTTFSVRESVPEPGSLRAQVITTPFQIVSMLSNIEQPVQFEPGEASRRAARTYRVTAGSFTVSGGIAGRSEEFQLGGEMRVMNNGRLATIIFDLRAANGTRALQTVATGVTQPGQIAIANLHAGTLIPSPHSGLQAAATYANEVHNLSVRFSSLPSNIADGFTGQGNVEAEVIATGTPR